MAEETKKEGGLLSRTFNWIASGFTPENLFRFAMTTAIGLGLGLWLGGFEDVFFFDPIHYPNTTVAAFEKYMQAEWGWIHEWTGFKGDGGLLNMDFVKDNTWGPYLEQVARVPVEQTTGLSGNSLLNTPAPGG